MKKQFVQFLFAVLLSTALGFSGEAAEEERCIKSPMPVLELFIRPQLYRGKPVFVEGYYVYKDSLIYPCSDLAGHFTTASAIVLLPKQEVKIGYLGSSLVNAKNVKHSTLKDCSNHYIWAYGIADLPDSDKPFVSRTYRLRDVSAVMILR